MTREISQREIGYSLLLPAFGCIALLLVAGCGKSQTTVVKQESQPISTTDAVNQLQPGDDWEECQTNDVPTETLDDNEVEALFVEQNNVDRSMSNDELLAQSDRVTVNKVAFVTQDEDEKEKEKTPLPKLEYETWEKPAVALFISGRQHGYIEPCGCTGLANQKGGLLRRDSLRRQIEEEKKWPLVKIDTGNQIRRFGVQPRMKLETSIKSIADVMNYDVMGIGPDDLHLEVTELLSATANNSPKVNDPKLADSDLSDADKMPFVASNVDIWESFSKFKVIERGGKKVGVMSVLGDEYPAKILNGDVEYEKVDKAITTIWPLLKAQACDINVLIAQTTLENSEALAAKYPHFDILVSTGGSGEPTMAPKPIKAGGHTTQMIQVGTKGMYVGVIGFYPGQAQQFRYQRIPLDERYKDSDEMKKIFIAYQKRLDDAGLDGLGLKPVPHPSGAQYVGSEACAECHDYAYEIWKRGRKELGDKFGPHSHATKSLVEPNERVWVTRFNDPECLSCHTTGWNPQRYFPYETGYTDLKKSEHLHGNGCENCHGPGSKHVAAENDKGDLTRAEIKALQKSMVLTLEEAKTNKCMECHDLDNSPDFHVKGAFDEYWKRIEHNE